jgi:hypothetical protein
MEHSVERTTKPWLERPKSAPLPLDASLPFVPRMAGISARSQPLKEDHMFELKPLSLEAVPAALERATRYRLLNEPGEAQSICLDVLQVDPQNQQAIVILVLALTDRFGKGYAIGSTPVEEVLARLTDPYEQKYYHGLVCERRAKAQLHQGAPGATFDAYEWLREAMRWYEESEAIRPAGNDDALLRWNACARMIMGNNLTPRQAEEMEPMLE